MRKCPNCGVEQTDHTAEFCCKCGSALKAEDAPDNPGAQGADDLDFTVTEATATGAEFVGGTKDFEGDAGDLGIQSSSDLLAEESAERASEPSDSNRPADLSPIGESEPPPPPEVADSEPAVHPIPAYEVPFPDPDRLNGANSFNGENPSASVPEKTEASQESDGYLSSREKEELMARLGKVDDDQAPSRESVAPTVVPGAISEATVAEADLTPPKMAGRGKGIAYFFKNYIQLVGDQRLHAGDELALDNRCYELQPKRLGTGVMIGGGIGAFLLLFVVIISLFVSGDGSGKGEIIGIVLDDLGQPYLQGATVRFIESGDAVKSSPLGFFRSGPMSSGTHQIEYRIRGELLNQDYATVADGEVTMVVLRPSDGTPEPTRASNQQSSSNAIAASTAKQESVAPPKSQSSKESSRSDRSSGKSSSKLCQLTLAANVEGARLELDGSVLGAGNLTYKRLKAGKHEYTVSADGYQPATGTVELQGGKTRKLEVALTLMTTAQKEQTYSAEDFYYSASRKLENGDVKAAIEDLTKAVSKNPGYGDAYLMRGDIYASLKNSSLAYADYLRAAEIIRMGGDNNRAITAFNSALEMNRQSLTAYLGRGDLYLAKGQEIAAMADFDAARDIDDKCFAAHYGLGRARFEQGNYKKAIDHFKDARKVDDRNPLVYQYLMLSYLARDDYKGVKKSFEKFTDIATEDDMTRLEKDQRFSAVLKVIETE